MMRALWTAASGMISQQTNVDTISNNLANVNTTGFKKETTEFKSLLYQNIQKNSYDSNGDPKPVGVQVGLGVRNSAITTSFTQGSMLESNGDYDFAIEGTGFFTIRTADGTTGYTRNGNFEIALGGDGYMLANSAGNAVLDQNGNPITFDVNIDTSKLSIDAKGYLVYPDENNNMQRLGPQIGFANFTNPAGLSKSSDSVFLATPSSGEPIVATPESFQSKIVEGYLEGSNVQTVDEMVNLIVAQRAYEMNSKAITAADTMLQQANNLRS